MDTILQAGQSLGLPLLLLGIVAGALRLHSKVSL
ncbi:hypothetical protein FHU39_002005 [Flexivirga oryzae]|uniref:Uncharacterized protein n=1 Tax=Flexivirga oryzae TaxID=1794944 RepID=A0A839NBC2_9MICO|nr:hypothetical protein [Flexivirga oryzae]